MTLHLNTISEVNGKMTDFFFEDITSLRELYNTDLHPTFLESSDHSSYVEYVKEKVHPTSLHILFEFAIHSEHLSFCVFMMQTLPEEIKLTVCPNRYPFLHSVLDSYGKKFTFVTGSARIVEPESIKILQRVGVGILRVYISSNEERNNELLSLMKDGLLKNSKDSLIFIDMVHNFVTTSSIDIASDLIEGCPNLDIVIVGGPNFSTSSISRFLTTIKNGNRTFKEIGLSIMSSSYDVSILTELLRSDVCNILKFACDEWNYSQEETKEVLRDTKVMKKFVVQTLFEKDGYVYDEHTTFVCPSCSDTRNELGMLSDALLMRSGVMIKDDVVIV